MQPLIRLGLAILVVIALAARPPSRRTSGELFASLRLARPQAVAAGLSAPGAASSNHQVQDAISGMVSPKPSTPIDDTDRPVASEGAAQQLAGFTPHLVRDRHDVPRLSVLASRDAALPVSLHQLRTILDEAGEHDIATPASLDGTTLTLHFPAAVRAQYGNCPAPAASTIQGQLQGPAPPSTDNGNCLVLLQSPPATGEVPGGLDMERLVEIAVELAGMSPNQVHALRTTLDWQHAITLPLPRGMRSCDQVTVQGVPAMLITTAGRRGPTWALLWSKDGEGFLLDGYGSPGDAVPLANSVR